MLKLLECNKRAQNPRACAMLTEVQGAIYKTLLALVAPCNNEPTLLLPAHAPSSHWTIQSEHWIVTLQVFCTPSEPTLSCLHWWRHRVFSTCTPRCSYKERRHCHSKLSAHLQNPLPCFASRCLCAIAAGAGDGRQFCAAISSAPGIVDQSGRCAAAAHQYLC